MRLAGTRALDTPNGCRGETCLWHVARKSSPESYAFMAEVSGSPKVSQVPPGPPIRLCLKTEDFRLCFLL